MEFDKNNKNFFSNFDKDNDKDIDFDFDDDNSQENKDIDFDFDDDNSQENKDIDFDFGDDEEDRDKIDFDFGDTNESDDGDFDFGDNDLDFDDSPQGKQNDKQKPQKQKSGESIFSKVDGMLVRILEGFGLREGGMLHKVVKYGIYLAVILFIVFFVIGYLVIGTLFGGSDEDNEGEENYPVVQEQESEDESFFEGVNSSIAGLFGSSDDGIEVEGEGINNVTVDASYEEDYLNLVKNNVFRYRQPAVINGTTFKLFNVEPYDGLTNIDDDTEYMRVDFGIKNESNQELKFTEYDFKLYTKEALESKDTEDEGYIGIDEESNSINVNVGELSESVKGLFVSQGIEPTIIRRGDNSTSLGKGVLKPDEVYSAFVVFEVIPDVENEYILGYYPTGYPVEMLMKTYE